MRSKLFVTLLVQIFVASLFAQNKLNSRLFYSKPKLYNSKSKVDRIALSLYEVTVNTPVDSRNQFYGETIYKNDKVRPLEEFFESPAMNEIQNKITSDLKKFKPTKRRAKDQLAISPSVEIFYTEVHGFIRGKSIAKVRLNMMTSLNSITLFQKKYESIYITDGMDKEFEGDITMTMEEGENITLGIALRKALDQFYLDLHQVLTLDKNKVILFGTVVNSKTGEAVGSKLLFQSDSTYSSTSASDGKFERILPKGKYQVNIVATNYLHFNEPIVLNAPETRVIQQEFKLQPIEKGALVNLKNVLFYMGTTHLLESSYAELDTVVLFLKTNPNIKIELHGHTDNQGDAQKDVALSKERVEKIKEYLTSNGIHSNRISGKGFGGTKPIASNATEEGRKLNRRVEFVIVRD